MDRWGIGGGRDGREELCDGGLRWIGGIAVTFAGWRRVAALACGGTRGEMDVDGDWAAVRGGMGSRGS